MYSERMRRNLRSVITEHGFEVKAKDRTLKSISPRHLWNIERGLTKVSVDKLEAIADEIGADFLEFFRK
jgi:transcriptional regulator with XRE-family HTH domain